MLRVSKDKRTLKENLMLAFSTAFVAGATNVTGHFATLARHVVENNPEEMQLFLLWLLLFFTGAFTANFLIRSAEQLSAYRANSRPVILNVLILLFVAIYGDKFYAGYVTGQEIIIGTIIFAMGLQNKMAFAVFGLGSDVSEWLHSDPKKKGIVKHLIYVRLTALAFYFIGGLAGGYFFDRYGFVMLCFIPLILLRILNYDLSSIVLHRLTPIFLPQKTLNSNL